ncbi:hypothetical protein JCM10599A_63630 [Paraburkholderia kururiensis]
MRVEWTAVPLPEEVRLPLRLVRGLGEITLSQSERLPVRFPPTALQLAKEHKPLQDRLVQPLSVATHSQTVITLP